MATDTFLFQAFLYLAAAVVSVPVARRLGLGSVLGYLIAGVAVGPFGLALVGDESHDVMHFAEFGVVMMLFLVGLELEPTLLWRLRAPILGLGGLQVVITSVLIGAVALALGLPWQASAAIGMTLAMSSTAIVLQSLNEKGLMKTAAGQSAFAVLLFQDLAVIPMLALFPLLAPAGAHAAAGEASHGAALVAGLPGWAQTLALIGAVGIVVLVGRLLVRPLLRTIARTRLRELFTAAALLLVIGIALLMQAVGLSPALGTFLAGVVLANSEYRHELEGDIEPFKGLLLGLFFISVGASIDLGLVAARPLTIAGLVAGIMATKLVVIAALGRIFRLGTDQNMVLSFALCQVGEFAFVLLSFATQQQVLSRDVAAPLLAVVALTMAATPLAMLFSERVVQPRVGTAAKDARQADAIDDQQPVIIAGFGRFGATVGRLLRANGVKTTVLDVDSDNVDLLRRLGLEVYYGDATRLDLLHAAGAERARLLILALDSPEKTRELVRLVRRHFPHLRMLARVPDRTTASDLLEAGVDDVYRETLDTSLRMGVDALRALGLRAYHAQRVARTFFLHDEASLREMAPMRADRAAYLNVARSRIEDLERQMLSDREDTGLSRDAGWDSESLREDANRGQGSGLARQ